MSWAEDCHFLHARIDGTHLTVRAIAAIDDPAATPVDIERFDPEGRAVTGPIEISL
jgi:hypothetical protein